MKLDVKFSESNQSFAPKLGGSDKTFGAEYSGVQTIHGRDGESAYEIAVKNGFVGSEDAWLDSLVGRPGKDGDKGDPFTYEDFTPEQLNSLKGKDGYTPIKGKDYFDGEDGYTPVKGKDYFDGKNGQDGSNGVDGVGIKSVAQTTTSTADDGNNVITVTLTNGTKSTFKVQNGSKGSAGANGKDGYTPVRGTDYWTAADKQEIAEEAAALVEIPESEGFWEQVEGESGVRLKGTGGSASGNHAISAGDDKTASNGTEYKSVASGDHAVAFGYGNTCSGRTTLAQGLYNIVTGKDCVAFGQKNTVGGQQAFAVGMANEITAPRNGVALGYGNKVTAQNGVALGWGNVANGDAAIAMGDACEASATSAVAMGYQTKASGSASVTFGKFTKTTGAGETAMGEYNQSVTSADAAEQTAFSFGIGTSDTNRANAFEIKKNGDVYIGGALLSDYIISVLPVYGGETE